MTQLVNLGLTLFFVVHLHMGALGSALGTLIATAARLCDAEMSMIGRQEGGMWRVLGSLGFPAEYERFERDRGQAAVHIPSSLPVVSGRMSAFAPMRSSSEANRLLSGVLASYR